MTFAAPLFLIAALAAAIPIALHMVSRRRAKEMPFSTLRFLKRSAAENAAAPADSRHIADDALRGGAAFGRTRAGPAYDDQIRLAVGQRADWRRSSFSTTRPAWG